MIEAQNITKTFGPVTALNNMSCQIQQGCIFGLVGSNGAGKSTFLRLATGVIRPDKGYLTINNQPVYENPSIKQRTFFIADQIYFPNQSSVAETVRFYRLYYPHFSQEIFDRLSKLFPVDIKRRFNQMSKGMQRQINLMLALACQPKYLFLDEAFDGLDPVVRHLLKRLLADSVASRSQTVIIASHNLRELEDICDHIGLLHQGGILFEQELDSLKLGILKVQVIFKTPTSQKDLIGLDILRYHTRGTLAEMVVRGQQEDILSVLQRYEPIFLEALPLTLEEVFIQELEVVGYDVNTILE